MRGFIHEYISAVKEQDNFGKGFLLVVLTPLLLVAIMVMGLVRFIGLWCFKKDWLE